MSKENLNPPFNRKNVWRENGFRIAGSDFFGGIFQSQSQTLCSYKISGWIFGGESYEKGLNLFLSDA